MAANPFEVNVQKLADRVLMELRGELNSFAEQVLSAAYSEAEGFDTPTILLDFSRVTYINSTGIALIVGLMSRAQKAGRRLVVFGLSDHYQEIFQITRLADYLSIVPDQASALAV